MYTNVIVTAKEFTRLHNAICSLDALVNELDGAIGADLQKRLTSTRDELRNSLKSAYKQDNDTFDAKLEHYRTVAEEMKLNSVWSIFSVKNLNAQHSFTGASKIHYKDSWGKPVTKDIVGSTWLSLFVAGNEAIKESGDKHHIYIEQFKPSKEDPSCLIMQTGS